MADDPRIKTPPTAFKKGSVPWNKNMPIIPDLCKCGCNEVVWDGHIYIRGHNTRVDNPSNDLNVRLKISKSHTGVSTCLKGKKYSAEHCKAISESLLKYKDVLTKEYLFDEYVIKKRRTKHIAEDVGCTSTTVVDYLHLHNIPIDFSIFKRHGSDNSMYGKHFNHTEEAKQKISKASKACWKNNDHREDMKQVAKERRQDGDYRNRMIKLLRKGRAVRPNKLEARVTGIINKHGLPYIYVGNGDVVLYGLNPDFINNNGQKKVIEVFGDYWHRDDVVHNWKGTEFGRKAVYSQLGYKSLVIWESEINSMTDDEITERIKKFEMEE